MDNKYETADHDYMHARDYFNNYKFGYIERTTKTLLLQSLHPEDRQTQDLLGILNLSKAQLKNVKSVSKEASNSISELSELIYQAKSRLAIHEEKLRAELEREEALNEEYSRLEGLDEKLRVYEELKGIVDKRCMEARENTKKIGILKDEIAMLNTKEAEEELKNMKLKRERLSGRHRRLSLITIENYMEESYGWYLKAVEFIRNVFDISLLTVEQEDNEMYLRFKVSNYEIGVFVRDGIMVDSKLYNTNDEEILAAFRVLSGFAISINDPRMLLMLIRRECG